MKQYFSKVSQLLVKGFKKLNAIKTSKLIAYTIMYSWLFLMIFDINVTLELAIYSFTGLLFAIYLVLEGKQTIHVHIHDGKKEK